MNTIEDFIRDIPNFPKQGILFKDIAPLLQNPRGVEMCLEELLKLVGDKKIDKVVGIESRGFFFATLLAQKLNAGFIPVRKPGKLPYKTIRYEYELEYGSDILEIHIDAIKPGQRVVIADDLIATGGTLKSTIKLIEQLGGEVVGICTLIELTYLEGRKKLDGYNVFSLIKY